MDTLWSVITWGLPWRWLKAVSLYVMGNLSLKAHVDAVDAAEKVLWGESLLDSLAELLDIRDDFEVVLGLSTLIFAGVLCVGGAGQVPEGNSSCMALTLGLEEGLLRVDRCCRSCSTHWEVLAEGNCKGFGKCTDLGM